MKEEGKSAKDMPVYESPKVTSLDASRTLHGGDGAGSCEPSGSGAVNNCFDGNNPDYSCSTGNSAGTTCSENGNNPLWVDGCEAGGSPE